MKHEFTVNDMVPTSTHKLVLKVDDVGVYVYCEEHNLYVCRFHNDSLTLSGSSCLFESSETVKYTKEEE